jgi:hypothetical protein
VLFPALLRLSLPAVTLGALALVATGCSTSYRVGDKVLAEWETNDYPASILAVEAPGRYKVHFINYDPIWDESVPATRIKGRIKEGTHLQAPPPPPKVKARMLALGNKTSISTYRAGDRVKVDWKGTFYPALILDVLGGERYRVHYEGYDNNWDENVDISRMQRK